MKLGFIGLGIMGAPMAGHLLAAGHELFAQSHGGVPAELQEKGAKVCANAREVAQQADRVLHLVHGKLVNDQQWRATHPGIN